MTKAEFLLELAEKVKATRGQEIALLASPDNPPGLEGIGVHAGDEMATYNTAIVNVLSNCAGQEISDYLCVSTYKPTEMCSGMKETLKVKPAFVYPDKVTKDGKWAGQIDVPSQAALERQANSMPVFDKRHMVEDLRKMFTDVPLGPFPAYQGCGWIDTVYMNLVMAMLGTTWNPNKGHDPAPNSASKFGGNNVAALLVEKDRIVAWGVNVMAQNKTFHAETVMLQAYLSTKGVNKLPACTKLVTSLQPCNMCGGFIHHVAHDTTEVIYGMKDGELKTVLTNEGKEQQLDLKAQVPMTRAFSVQRPGGKGRDEWVQPSPGGGTIPGRLQDLKPNISGPSTVVLVDTETYKLGNAFQQFPQWLLETREKLKTKPDNNDEKKAVDHALALLKNVATRGMMTTYGIDLIEAFFEAA